MLVVLPDLRQTSQMNIVVKYLPQDLLFSHFKKIFEAAGEVSYYNVRNNRLTPGYNIGFIMFEDKKSAQKCINMFDGSSRFGIQELEVSAFNSATGTP